MSPRAPALPLARSPRCRACRRSRCLSGCATAPAATSGAARMPPPPPNRAAAAAAAAAATVATGRRDRAPPGSARQRRAGGGRRRAAAAGPAETVRRRDQGREGDARTVPRSGRRTRRSGSRSRPSSSTCRIFFSTNLSRARREAASSAGMMRARDRIVEFRKVGSHVQLIAQRTRVHRRSRRAEARAVRGGASPTACSPRPPIVSQPHPERKSVLIEANALLLDRHPGRRASSSGVPQVVRVRRAQFELRKARATPELIVVQRHRALCARRGAAGRRRCPAPMPLPALRRRCPTSAACSWASLQLRQAARDADARRALPTRASAISRPRASTTPRHASHAARHYVNRWRLEKKDPAAALSEPKQPIVFWLDRNSPGEVPRHGPRRRAGVEQGVRAHRFQGRVVVKQQDADGDDRRRAPRVDALDRRHRRAVRDRPAQVDPRTGEILDADIGIPTSSARGARTFIAEQAPSAWPAFDAYMAPLGTRRQPAAPTPDAAAEMQFALDLLVERARASSLDSPEADALRRSRVKARRHARGRAHARAAPQLPRLDGLRARRSSRTPRSPATTASPASVMDYNAAQPRAAGERQGEYVMSTLGPYDYWAIEYGYRPLPEPAETDELAQIAARAPEPLLAFTADEDVDRGPRSPT